MSLEYQNIILKDKPKTFENFIELYSYHNMQTFFISGLPLEEIKSNPQIAFEKTKKIIQEHYTGFIFTEYFNESLLLLNKELKFKKLFYKKENVSKNKIELPLNYKELIMKYNEADILLYKYLLNLFQEKRKEKKYPR